MQARRGVKRQADTTTPSTGQPSPSSLTHVITSLGPPGRRESTRQVKRPKLDLPGEKTYQKAGVSWFTFSDITSASVSYLLLSPFQSRKVKPLSTQLKFCSALIKEFFTKKHMVSLGF